MLAKIIFLFRCCNVTRQTPSPAVYLIDEQKIMTFVLSRATAKQKNVWKSVDDTRTAIIMPAMLAGLEMLDSTHK